MSTFHRVDQKRTRLGLPTETRRSFIARAVGSRHHRPFSPLLGRSDLNRLGAARGAILGTVAGVGPRTGLSSTFAARLVEPAGKKHQAILHRSEHLQHFEYEPQIKAQQSQGNKLEPMNDDPAIQIQPARLRGLVRPDRTDNSRSRFRRSRFAGASSTASPQKEAPPVAERARRAAV
jgi:hypothetical protein